MSKEQLEEIRNEIERSNSTRKRGNTMGAEQMILDLHGIGRFEWLIKYAKEQVERVQELEKEFELCDSTMHMIDMTINNPSTSDDDKWEKVNKIIKKYYADNCIHCNSKGFNGLDYCPNCIRGAVIQENLDLEQQNKRYREAIERIKEAPRKAHSGSDCVDIIFEIIEALEGESE